MTIRDDQKEKRRLEILFAALELFVRKGYAATKISDIAAAVNMSVGLLFHYFESKENLCKALVEIGLRGTRMAMNLNREEPLDFFKKSAEQIFQSLREQPWSGNMFVFMAQVQRTDGVPEEARRLALQVNNIEQSVEILRKGQNQGTIRQGNPFALSNAFWCSVQGIAEQLAVHPEIPFPEADWLIDMIKNHEEEKA